jgi:hypothetical protein
MTSYAPPLVDGSAPVLVGEQSVTIKYGKGYDESWAVFRGTIWEIRANLVAYFGISVDYASSLTLNELVVAATHVAHGTGNVAAILGGTPAPISVTESLCGEPTGEAALAQVEADAKAGKLPYGGSQAEPVDPNVELVQQLQAALTVDDLKKLWTVHQAAFSDKAVKAAYSKRGKALKAAEKAAA